MKKILIIFGSDGFLGSGVTSTMLNKNYDEYFLFDFKFRNKIEQQNVRQIQIEDLAIESNVEKSFNNIKSDSNTSVFLFSTVGGFAGGKNIWEADNDEWEKMFRMNFISSRLIAKHFSRLVMNCDSGSILFTAAFTGIKSIPKNAAYGASKSSLIHLVYTLAEEGKSIRLTANAIAPLIIDTPPNREWMKKDNYDDWIKPDEIGEFVHSVFINYSYLTGNIFKLTHRFELK
jgi:NAD(P)-dependent dehydrogenase (short-subunit alcohol dehydrogenase family)